MKENKSLFYQAQEAEDAFRLARLSWLQYRLDHPSVFRQTPKLLIAGRPEPIRQQYLEGQIDAEFKRR